jgi:phenylalanyl-tRNA synthetase beta chain
MKLPISWLKELTSIPMNTEELADQLTMLGIEVDKIHTNRPSFEGVVVGEVLSTAPHPNADQLQIAQVSDGSATFQVVCGAPNCRPGLKTPFARVGAKLGLSEEKPFKIKRSKIRGIESDGMLCSESELGLSEAHVGIAELSDDCVVGEDLARRYEDEILEISLTPNLGHCASALGIAREIAALAKGSVTLPETKLVEMGPANAITVVVDQPELCPRYGCRIIRDVKVGPSPEWLKERLVKCGLRSINNVVDVTNYVMLERGQPLHAFDEDKLRGHKLVIRLAEAEEELETLDGERRELLDGMLVICDAEKPVAVAGVMGGANSEVTDETTAVVLEAAYFEPRQIMRTSRRLGVQTESSRRFERECDPNGVFEALDRAAALIAHLSGGQVAPGLVEKSEREFAPKRVSLRLSRVNELLGTQLSLGEIEEILARLECPSKAVEGELLEVVVPTYRADLKSEIDLVEEVARLYGYANIPEPAPRFAISRHSHAPLFLFQREVQRRLIGMGLRQTISCDLISPSQLSWLDEDRMVRDRCIEIVNPGSADHSILRPSLLPGLLATMRYNAHRQVRDLALFETGLGHQRTGEGYEEHALVALLLTGRRLPLQWSETGEPADFFDLKGIVEMLLEGLSLPKPSFGSSSLANFHPGRQALICVGGLEVGVVGEIHPATLRLAAIQQPLLFAELNLDDLLHQRQRLTSASAPPLYPSSERDWTITLPEGRAVGDVFKAIQAIPSQLLQKVTLLSIYRGDTLNANEKNVTFRFLYRDERKTLSDERVEAEHRRMIERVVEVLK